MSANVCYLAPKGHSAIRLCNAHLKPADQKQSPRVFSGMVLFVLEADFTERPSGIRDPLS